MARHAMECIPRCPQAPRPRASPCRRVGCRPRAVVYSDQPRAAYARSSVGAQPLSRNGLMSDHVLRHTRSLGNPQRVLLIGTSLVLAVASGLFVAGVGNAVLWFLFTLVISTSVVRFFSKGHASVERLDPAGDTPRVSRVATFVVALSSTVALAWLVLHREPLPWLDLGTSALATALFCILTIVLVLSIHRLPLLSFPGLFLGATFLFTCSALVLYQSEGIDAFSRWQLIDIPSVLIAMPVVMLAFSSFLIGALLVRKPLRVPDAPSSGEEGHSRTLRKIGIGLYVVSIATIGAFTLTGSALSFAFEGGYEAYAGARKAGELSQILRVAFDPFLPWSILILAATSKNRGDH